MVIHLAHGQSNSSGLTGLFSGIMLFLSLSRERAFLMSTSIKKKEIYDFGLTVEYMNVIFGILYSL